MITFFIEHGVRAGTKNPFDRNRISRLLSNPFYIGLFKYAGEIYEGKHEAIIPKKLFDRVQAVLADRGRPHKKPKNEPQPLCGLFRCGECGASITAENRIKRQVNGTIHNYIYYRCTKKKGACSQPHIRDGELAAQLSDILKEYALPQELATELTRLADEDEKEETQLSQTASQAPRDEILEIKIKLQRLLTTYLDQDIDQETYRSEKSELLLRKKSLDEKIASLGRGSVAWLEPLREWIKDSVLLGESAVPPSLVSKKSSALKIFGSNLFLKDRRIVFAPILPSDALRASRKNLLMPRGASSVSGICNDVGTYWLTTNDRFYIPTLSLEAAKIN